MKIDFESAPRWAKWGAMDEDGDWWWFENKPSIADDDSWVADGRVCMARFKFFHGWVDTLQARP